MAFALWSDGRDGWDRCTATALRDGHLVTGTVHVAGAPRDHDVSYEFETDRTWAVRRVRVADRLGVTELRREGMTWCDGMGRVLDHLEGCLDVDADWTPAALAPHFRRLALVPGERLTHAVVRVGLDPRVVDRVEVTVAHLDEHHWSHDRAGSHARIHLGAAGLVIEHDHGWTALAVG